MKINENTKEQLKEDLRKTREALAVQKWGLEKTLWGMKVLVKEFIQKGKEIEEAKAKDEALVKDLEKFKLAVENTSGHIIITDPDGIILFANKAAEKTTGYSQSEIIGKSPSLWGKKMPKDFYEKMWKTIKVEKKNFAAEIVNTRKNGIEYVAEVKISSVLDKDGNILFFVGLERDITKEREIDKVKTEFVSLASHQLRTPLSTVNWYSEMLLAGDVGELNKEQKKYLDEVYRGNQRMVGLVNSLLNVSRLELGTFSVEPKPTDITKIAKDVVEEQRPEMNKHTLVLKETYTAGLPKINADPKLLHMVFDNLLSNAIKYMPKKGKIDISIKKETDHILISIADTGMGIPKSQQDKIFTKFFRADNVREHDTEGTGLGLYITKSIIEHSGGKIWFESLENNGTTFYIVLPLVGMRKKDGTKQLS